jgi:tetratricopeptide (TPR) repeat protein
MTTTFQVNPLLELRLEGGHTNIYVDGIFFSHCKFLLLNIPTRDIEAYDAIESIDEAAEFLDNSLEPVQGEIKGPKIPSHVEFWGHCSNLQVWYENSYNTCLIHRNLGFPLLKELTDAGDMQAAKIFKEEIATRLESKYLPVVIYLIRGGYLEYLTYDDRAAIGFDRIDTFFELVQEYYDHPRGQNLDLKAIFNYVSTLIPRTAGEWSRKAALYKILKMGNKHYECYRKGVKQFPNNVNLLYNLLEVEQENGNENIITIVRRLTRLVPEDPSFWALLGVCYKNHSNYPKAIECIQKALDLEPENVKYVVNFINILEGLEDSEMSFSLVESALDHFHADIDACTQIAQGCTLTTNAELAYKFILCHNPSDADSWMSLATIYRGRERLLRARVSIKKCIKAFVKFPNDHKLAEAYAFLGEIYAARSRLDDALRYFEYAGLVDPEYIEVWYSQAKVYALKGNLQKADECRRKAEALKKKDNLEMGTPDAFKESFFDNMEHPKILGRGRSMRDLTTINERLRTFFRELPDREGYVFQGLFNQEEFITFLLGFNDNDTIHAFSSLKGMLRSQSEKIETLLKLFEGKELKIVRAEKEFVLLDGDKDALEQAFEQGIVLRENSVLD